MTPTFSRSLVALSIAAIASAGVLSGCERKTTTTSTDGTSSTTTSSTTTTSPTPSSNTTAVVQGTADNASAAMSRAGDAVEDSAITAKVKTALLADPTVKGLQIDVDTKNGVVTLKGNAPKAESDRAVQIARDTGGVKSVENQLTPKS